MIDPLISTQRLFLGLLSMQKKFNGDKKKGTQRKLLKRGRWSVLELRTYFRLKLANLIQSFF